MHLFNKWVCLKMDLAEFHKHIPRWDPHQDIHKLRDPFMLNVVYTSDWYFQLILGCPRGGSIPTLRA